MKRAFVAVVLAILCLAGCGGSSSSAAFPPKSEKDLHALAQESKTSVTVVGHDETSSAPRTAVLFVVMPRGLSQKEQVEALLKVLYDKHLDSKVGHEIESAVVLGYRTSKDVGNRYNAGRVELDSAGSGKKTVILNADGGGPGQAWKLTY